jgi:hypothetical protein
MKYLGFIIQAGKGVHINLKKVEAIRAWEALKSIYNI